MLAFTLSSRSVSEETYHTAEEDHSCYVPSFSPDSVYATANQTPKASPDMDKGTASSIPIVAQTQESLDALRRVEHYREERVERASPRAAVAPSEVCFTQQAEANADVEQQIISFLLRENSTVSGKDENALGMFASPTFSSA